ncbi:PTS system mannose/fructose/sorbose family transporter subunit IID [Hespellia stercorisuis]|uniref:PTS system IID component, Man family (TC 4.A.6) n=1 Tax=Hespellia stercorisuis DSM 15480 TaxID=1121950 RepID=A0A1M6SYA7_9FIRM|nr:PTS system mannose/fructose/sorbose family transporter subunit IID [Hespellia stercorisuis]SHK49659.1 PTS system IID component, Man family (TC 4.A.6) [Hespellia stercorisuis DSM 15480]
MEEQRVKLSKKDVLRAFWKWTFFSHSNYNYERLQASGVLQSMSHIPEKLYPGDKEEQKKFMQRHMSFYNTEPHFGGIINGMVLAMEEERANGASIDDDAINSIKTGLMGPIAGIGDTLWQGTLQPIALAVGISIAAGGNVIGALVFALIMIGVMLPIGYFMYMKGYTTGKTGVEAILSGGKMKQIIQAASIMGATVLGSLTANYVTAKSTMNISVGSSTLALQTDILDKLLLGGVPLGITLLTLYLLKNKKMKSTTVMLILVIIGLICGATGILG